MSNVTDTFGRAAATDLGFSDTGQAWANFGGGVVSLDGAGHAVTSTASSDAGSVIDSGSGDATYQVTFVNASTVSSGLFFRWSDGANWWAIQMISGNLYTRKVVAGVNTNVKINRLTFADNDVFAVVCSGSSITVKQNGAVVTSFTDSFNLAATVGGIMSRPSSTYDNFSITNAAGGASPTQLTMGQQPTGAGATNPLATQPIVQVRDSGSVLCTGDTSTITATLNTVSGGVGAVLTGTTAKAAVGGQASFTNLAVSVPGTYTLTFTDGTLTPVTSAQFTISARGSSPYLNLATDGKDIGYDKSLVDPFVAIATSGDRRSVTEVRYGGASQFFQDAGINQVQYPRTLLNTDTFPTRTGVVRSVNSDATLVAALSAAAPGDWIVVDHTVTYTGNYYNAFPVKAGDAAPGGNNVIVVISKAIYDSMVANGGVATVCPQKVRVTAADRGNLAKFRGSDSLSAFMVAGATKGWRFVGLDIGVVTSLGQVSHLACLGNPDSSAGQQDSVTKCPSNLGFDRCWFDGHATLNMKHCVELHCINGYVIDCGWGDNVHIDPAVVSECHAIIGYNGPGPFRIVNNRIVGGSQSIFFGGGLEVCGMVADVEVRYNYMTRPVAWNNNLPATWDGSNWAVKCNFEIKKAQYVLVEGNVNENIWPKAQAGAAFLLKSESYGDGPTIGWTANVLVRWNLIRNCGFGANIASAGQPAEPNPTPPDRVWVVGNVMSIGAAGYDASTNPMVGLGSSSNSGIVHNTFIADGNVNQSISLPDPSLPTAAKAPGLVVKNNIFDKSNYGWKPSGGTEGDVVDSAPGCTVDKNVVVGVNPAGYPVTTYAPATQSAIIFTDATNKDYSLNGTTQGTGGGSPPPAPAVATALTFLTQPASATNGAALVPAPVVGVLDQYGAAFPTTLTITLAPDAPATLTGGGSASTAGGSSATFASLSLTAPATTTTRLTASAPGLASITSNSFTLTVPVVVTPPPVVPPGPPAQIVATVQPAGAVSGLPLTTPPALEIRDAQGYLNPTSSVAATLSIQSVTPALGVTMPPVPVTAVNGVVTFTPAILTGVGTVTLQASAPGLGTCTFAPVTVTAQPPSSTTTDPSQPFVRRRRHRLN